MTLMAQRIWSCGCLPGSDCQVSSAEGGFRLIAVIQFWRIGDRCRRYQSLDCSRVK